MKIRNDCHKMPYSSPTCTVKHPSLSLHSVCTYVDDGEAAIEVVLTATEVGEEEAVAG